MAAGWCVLGMTVAWSAMSSGDPPHVQTLTTVMSCAVHMHSHVPVMDSWCLSLRCRACMGRALTQQQQPCVKHPGGLHVCVSGKGTA
jgi:hypothetical protein